MRIAKLGYSSCPWRLLDENSQEIYEQKTIDHPNMGKQQVNMPVCANTKQELIEKLLLALAKARLVASINKDLLEALEPLTDSFECYVADNKPQQEWDEYDHMMLPRWQKAREAIKKARGEQ